MLLVKGDNGRGVMNPGCTQSESIKRGEHLERGADEPPRRRRAKKDRRRSSALGLGGPRTGESQRAAGICAAERHMLGHFSV